MLLLLLILVALSLPFLVLSKRRRHGDYNPPPGPKGLPLIGNLFDFNPSVPYFLHFAKLGKIYGPILSLRLGCRSAVVIQSTSMANEILKAQDHNFCTRPNLVAQQRLSYNGLDIAFSPSSEYFREIRKTCVVHFFNPKNVRSSSHIRKEEVSKMIQKIDSLSSPSRVINVSELLICLTSSVICRSAFSKRYEDEDVERSRFHYLTTEIQAMLATFFFSDYLPYIGYWLDMLTGQSSRLEKIFKEMDEFYDEIISDHLDSSKPRSGHEDVVDVLLREHCFPSGLPLHHIKGVLMNIITGGTDTSAGMVVWVMMELIKNPTIMRKVQNELTMICGDESFVEENDLPKLEYLKAVIKETFRLHPIAPLLIVREALQKCIIQGYDILPKTLVYVNVWAIGRDPSSWKDPELFLPERFLGSSIKFTGQDFGLIPFGAGRRKCPGMSIGTVNLELALANLLHCFNWELPIGVNKEDIDWDVIPGIAMHKKNPLCLVATKRVHETYGLW